MSDNPPEAADPAIPDRAPTREELDADMSIPASFDEVLDRIIAGHGTESGHHSV